MVLFPDEVMNKIREHCLDLAKLEWIKKRTSDIQRIFDRYDFVNCLECKWRCHLMIQPSHRCPQCRVRWLKGQSIRRVWYVKPSSMWI